MELNFDHDFGVYAECGITGLKGVITGRGIWLQGSLVYLISPRALDSETDRGQRDKWINGKFLTEVKESDFGVDARGDADIQLKFNLRDMVSAKYADLKGFITMCAEFIDGSRQYEVAGHNIVDGEVVKNWFHEDDLCLKVACPMKD